MPKQGTLACYRSRYFELVQRRADINPSIDDLIDLPRYHPNHAITFVIHVMSLFSNHTRDESHIESERIDDRGDTVGVERE